MYTLAFIVLIFAGFGNMVADYLLYSGKEVANPNQTKQEIALATPEKEEFLGKVLKRIHHYDSIAGSVSIVVSLLSLTHIMLINHI